MTNLWSANSPADFWRCLDPVPAEHWHTAIERAIPVLKLPVSAHDLEGLLAMVLGESQFGSDHWRLTPAVRAYYWLKPMLPRPITRQLRRLRRGSARTNFPLGWPVEERYVRFLWEVMRQLLILSSRQQIRFRPLWPEGRRFALVLTHDVETAAGQRHVRAVAELEEQLGFRSSFNFIPERYPLDWALLTELRERGFEVGLHGLKHDGKLFDTHSKFMRRARRINSYLEALGAVGFRAPLTHRNPEWMQALNVEYDLSFFDTDPFEPIPGGTMSIWPFMLGRFVELPYTLVQDYTLIEVLGETTPKLWLDKVRFIEQYHGMALVNAHPDCLLSNVGWQVYAEFLEWLKDAADACWHALARDAAAWWRARATGGDGSRAADNIGLATLSGDELRLADTREPVAEGLELRERTTRDAGGG